MADKELQSLQTRLFEKMRCLEYAYSYILVGLEREVLIVKPYGVGTAVKRHLLDDSGGADIEIEFMQMISRSVFTPKETVFATGVRQVHKLVSKRFSASICYSLLFVSRIVAAYTKLVGFHSVYIIFFVEKNDIYANYVFNKPIFNFSFKCCSAYPCLDLTEIRISRADSFIADVLCIDEESPYFLWKRLTTAWLACLYCMCYSTYRRSHATHGYEKIF